MVLGTHPTGQAVSWFRILRLKLWNQFATYLHKGKHFLDRQDYL